VGGDKMFRDGAAKDWEKMDRNKIAMAEKESHGWTEQVQVEGMSLRRHVRHLERIMEIARTRKFEEGYEVKLEFRVYDRFE
jgi:hypothetical protein